MLNSHLQYIIDSSIQSYCYVDIVSKMSVM